MALAILVDTDVMVEYLRGQDKAIAFVRKNRDRIILSAIVVAELYAGVRDEAEQGVLDELVSLFRIAPVTAEIAKAGGLLKRDFSGSHGVGLADAILAATAQAENAELCTFNVKHYPMVARPKPPYARR